MTIQQGEEMIQGGGAGPGPNGSGFTLLECLTALAVMALLAAFAVPQMRQLIASRSVAAHVDTFTSALRFARSEAARRNEAVSVCASLTADAAEPECAATASAGWQGGWLVFVDRGAVGEVDDGDEVIRVEQALAASGGIRSSRRCLTFRPQGLALNATGSYTFAPRGDWSEADRAGLTRTVCVNKQGRARAVSGSCA
jgi:type IV fimbrial biogenesis protein FimT